MVKFIFLDIDGVLVTRRLGVFEEPLLLNLKRVVDETGATIVLSSDWRRHPAARMEAKRVLATVGLSFVACTPCLSAYIAQRPTEIMQWKKEYCKRVENDRLTTWVAIDDRPLIEERHGTYLRGHFVQTQPMHGLTKMASDECIAILNQEPPPPPRSGAQTGGSEAMSPADGLTAMGAALRVGSGSGSSGMRGSLAGPSGHTGPLLGGNSGSKRNSLPSEPSKRNSTFDTRNLGPGVHSFGLANGGEGDSPESPARPTPAGLPSVGRSRGRSTSTGAPPMVGLARERR